MIEIVFGESACGSLKIAQTYGKGKYRGSAVSIFMRHEDGSVPSSDEMKKAQLQAQEYIDTDRGIVDISCRPERTGTGTVRHHHGADENCRGRNRGIEAYPPNGMGAALQ